MDGDEKSNIHQLYQTKENNHKAFVGFLAKKRDKANMLYLFFLNFIIIFSLVLLQELGHHVLNYPFALIIFLILLQGCIHYLNIQF